MPIIVTHDESVGPLRPDRIKKKKKTSKKKVKELAGGGGLGAKVPESSLKIEGYLGKPVKLYKKKKKKKVGKKAGGVISYKMSGGQVVDAGYE